MNARPPRRQLTGLIACVKYMFVPEDFDPYRKWLGIPPAEQPADHYRLLGVGRFEDDADTIDSAADRQMGHVRTFQTGPHSALSQKLLNEISAARVCLLNPAQKAEYDARLKAKLAESEARLQARLASQAAPPAAVPVAMPVPQNSPAIEFTAPSAPRRAARRKKKSPLPAFAAGGAALLAVVVIAVALRRGGDAPDDAPPSPTVEQPADPSFASGGPAARPTDVASPPADGQQPVAPNPPEATKPAAAPPAAAGLEIVEATWGKDDRWSDITQRVRSLVSEGCLLATADRSFFEGQQDPAFGQVKQVRIRYKIAGEPGEREFNHAEFIYLDGRPAAAREPSSNGLEVLEARYGAGATWLDVLPRLRRWIHGDRLAVRVSLLAQPDPVPGVSKALFLRYRTPDGEYVCHAWDGQELVLDARPLAAAGKPTDLIAAADPAAHSSGAKWRKEGGALVAPDGAAGNLPIPIAPAGDYLLTVVIAGRPCANNVGLTLPIGDRRVQLAIDGWKDGQGGATSALQLIDGAMGDRNETARRGTFFETSQTTTIRCSVRKSSVYATANGRLIADWSGDVSRLAAPGEAATGGPADLVVRGIGVPWMIERLEIAPLVAVPPRAAPASQEVVDLLKLIDPTLDAVSGEWKMSEKGLLSAGGQWMRLGVPYLPPDDYELRVVAARQQGDDVFGIGLIVDGRQAEAVIDGWRGSTRGLRGLDGGFVEINAAPSQGAVFVDDQPKKLVCTVHPGSIRVAGAGQTLIEWHGDARQFTLKHDLPDQLGLQLSSHATQFLISKLELRPLPPETPSEVAAQRAADARRPLPKAAELAKAEKQVAEIYDPHWKAAKKLPERLAVALKVYIDGQQTVDNPIMRYALLREAEHRFAELGDGATACDAIDFLARDFQIDAPADKLTAASDAWKKVQTPAQLWTLALRVLALVDAALLAERDDDAAKLISLVTQAGRRLKSADLQKQAERLRTLARSRHDRQKLLENVLVGLKDKPDDPGANLAAGVGLCLLRGDWQRGLPLLARSGDKRMVEIAKLEAAAGQDAAKRPALMDAWLAEAANQRGAMRAEYELQAKYWLGRGLLEPAAIDPAHKRTLEKLPGASVARLKPGLDMAMFNGADFEDFRARRVADGMFHNFGFDGPHPSVSGDGFSVRWTGWIKPPLPGKYVIQTNSDDGCRLRINNQLLIDHWHRGSGEERAEVELTDQLQPFSVEFNDTGATAAIRVAWALKDFSDFQSLPPEVFCYDPAN